MAKIGTLFYFDIDGRSSALRMMLAHSKQNWVDERLGFDVWPTRKAEMLGGSMPNWVEPNGTRMNESIPLLRYLGARFGYYPKTEYEAYKADMLLSVYADKFAKICGTVGLGKPDEAFAKEFCELMTELVARLDKELAHGKKFLCGDKICIADFLIGAFYFQTLGNEHFGCKDLICPKAQPIIDGCPNVKAYFDRICEENKDWLSNKRPPRPI